MNPEQVKARIAELKMKLLNPDLNLIAKSRLEGNIGALEWVLREMADNYEPPQSFAQRTMVITAEDPDFA